MHIPFLNKIGKKYTAYIIFDVGSGSVAASVVAVGVGKTSKILANGRKTISYEERSEDQLKIAINTALKEVGELVFKKYTTSSLYKSCGPIEKAYVSLHNPWSYSVTEDFTSYFDELTEITEKIISDVVSSSTREPKETFVSKGNDFEHSVSRIELSGYPTSNPVGKKAKSIRVVSIKSTGGNDFIQRITDTVVALIPGHRPEIRSAIYVYNTVLHNIYPRSSDYVFLDIGSESSVCNIIRNGAIREQLPINVGTRSLLKATASKNPSASTDVHSMIQMAMDGNCTDAACEEIRNAIAAAEPIMMKSFGETFSSLVKEARLPNSFVISVHPKVASWARAFFSRIDFSQFTQIGRPFKVKILTSENLSELITFTPNTKQDTGSAVTSAFVHIRNAQ